jgi:hypothetical protein
MTVNCAGGYWCSGFRNRTASGTTVDRISDLRGALRVKPPSRWGVSNVGRR